MKLQDRYTRITLISTLLILLIAAGGYYLLLRIVLINELDDALKVEEIEIQDFVKTRNSLPPPSEYKDQRISYERTDKPVKRQFQNFSYPEDSTNDIEHVRRLIFPLSIKGNYYAVTVSKSEESTKDLLFIIVAITVGLIILLIFAVFLINRLLFRKLWKPFRNILDSIKEFKLSAPTAIRVQPSSIAEFRELSQSVQLMSTKVLNDYQSLKNFTAHASHEMQTPLAIINSKLDILIQQPEHSEKTMTNVHGIYRAVDKLSGLCNSLLTLTKIENNQYTLNEWVPLSKIITEKGFELEELINSMELKLEMEVKQVSIKMNKDLAEMLISNLFINAIRHNIPGGIIRVEAGNEQLVFKNSGMAPLDKERIFDRFYKSDNSAGSGLGLAILKQICEQYRFDLNYYFEKDFHIFKINFSPGVI